MYVKWGRGGDQAGYRERECKNVGAGGNGLTALYRHEDTMWYTKKQNIRTCQNFWSLFQFLLSGEKSKYGLTTGSYIRTRT